jgi:oligoribonuclease (3'-5' exoribonuclease)
MKVKFTKRDAHRALDDIEGSIEEISYYLTKVKGSKFEKKKR